MTDAENTNRPANDLALPETMKIAALLAELMPGGAPVDAPVLAPASANEQAVPEDAIPVFSPNTLAIEELDAEPPSMPATPDPAPERRITATVTPASTIVVSPTSSRLFLQAPTGTSGVVVEVTRSVPADAPLNLGEKSTGAVLGGFNWKNDPHFGKPRAERSGDRTESANANRDAADTDLIPVGDLKAGAFFSAVNWRNDPDRAGRLRRCQLGLDESTLILAKIIPFYVAGQPRVPDTASVAAVLSQVVWE
jgi:hypothetical protein